MKKVFSLMLAFLLVLSLFPVNVRAEEEAAPEEVLAGEELTVDEEAELPAEEAEQPAEEEELPAEEEELPAEEAELPAEEEELPAEEEFPEEGILGEAAPSDYNLWVGGIPVTAENLSGDGWSYDPADKALTLNNFHYAGKGFNGAGTDSPTTSAAIFSEGTLTIYFSGTNDVELITDEGEYHFGIYVSARLMIYGSGVLNVKCDTNNGYGIRSNDFYMYSGTVKAYGRDAGISCWGYVRIEDGSIEVETAQEGTSDKEGLWTDGTINICGGSVTANAGGKGIGIGAGNLITMYRGSVIARGSYAGITANGIYGISINDGYVMARGDKYGICAGSNFDGEIRLKGGTVTAIGNEGALTTPPSLDNKLVAKVSDDPDGRYPTEYNGDITGIKWFHAELRNYPIYIAGVQVTALNAGDLTVIDGVSVAEGGKVCYDEKSNTLTLKDATITNRRYTGTEARDLHGIFQESYTSGDNLTLKVEGTNVVNGGSGDCSEQIAGIYLLQSAAIQMGFGSVLTVKSGYNYVAGTCGIRVGGTLSITGKGTLNVNDMGANDRNYGIMCSDLSVEDTTLNAAALNRGDTYGAYIYHRLTMGKGAKVNFTGDYGIGTNIILDFTFSDQSDQLLMIGHKQAFFPDYDYSFMRRQEGVEILLWCAKEEENNFEVELKKDRYSPEELSSYKKLSMLPTGDSLPLFIGESQITTYQAGDLFRVPGVILTEDGVASFTSATDDSPAILTLKGFTYNGKARVNYSNGVRAVIQYAGDSDLIINIDGENTVILSGDTGYGIWCSKALTIQGPGSLTVSGVTQALSTAPTLRGLSARGSTDKSGSNPERYDASKNDTYKWFETFVEPFDLYVGSVQVNTANASNVLGDEGTPTVTFDCDSRTLTLDNAAVKGDFKYYAGIESFLAEPLTIKLVGKNTVKMNLAGGYGIKTAGDLNITGTGSLETQSRIDVGITSSGKITITGGTVSPFGGTPEGYGTQSEYENSAFPYHVIHGSYGIEISGKDTVVNAGLDCMVGDVSILDSTVTADSSYDGYGIATGKGNITISGKNAAVEATGTKAAIHTFESYDVQGKILIDPELGISVPEGGAVSSGGETILDKNGEIAKHVKIGKATKLTGLAFAESNVEIPATKTKQLQVVYSPENVTDKTLIWTSSNDKIAAVDSEGKVTGKVTGKVQITAASKDGSVKAVCNVRVLFSDVTDKSKANFEAIYSLVDKGVISGFKNGEYFAPNDKCTRAQVVLFLWRAAGKPKPKAATLSFKDAKDIEKLGTQYRQAVLWGNEKGIVMGFTSGANKGKFMPNDPCTRAQIVLFLYRYAGRPKVTNTALNFKDAAAIKKMAKDYTNAILWAVEKKITTGYKVGSGYEFRPDQTCTRGECATFLYRLIK